MSDDGIGLLRVVNNKFLFNTDKLCRAIRQSGEAGTTEVQTIAFPSNVTGGVFTLTHDGNTTNTITFSTNVTTLASNMQTALRTVPGLGAVTVTWSSGTFGSSTVTFEVTFKGVIGDTPQMTSYSSALIPPVGLTHATTTGGVLPQAFMKAGKFICYGNTLANKNIGTVELVNRFESDESTATFADRLIAFSSDGERADAFHATAAPTPTSEAMEFTRGQSIRNDQPSANGDPGWVCTSTGKPATFKALGNLDA